MVSIVVNDMDEFNPLVQPFSRTTFLREYRADAVTDNFCRLIFGERIVEPDEIETNDANVACNYLFYSFKSGEVKIFRDVVETFSRRELNVKARWWQNDLLLFGLVLCASKYGEFDEWILKVLRHRADNSSGIARDISLTFIDVLAGNWSNSENIRSISLVSHDLLLAGKVDKDLILSAYDSIANGATISPNTGFLEVIGIRAFDIAIIANLPISGPYRRACNRLVVATWRLSKICALALWIVILLGAMCGLILLLSWAWHLEELSIERNLLDFLARIGIPLMSLLPFGALLVKRRFIVVWLQYKIAHSLFDFDSFNLLIDHDKNTSSD